MKNYFEYVVGWNKWLIYSVSENQGFHHGERENRNIEWEGEEEPVGGGFELEEISIRK